MAKSNTVSKLVAQLIGSPMFNLSLSSKELFHSNFLAWLGNNSSTKDFFAAVINDLIPGLQLSATGSWTVEREEKHFDLSIKDGNNYLAVIENKVKSVPMAKQLNVYANKVKSGPKLLLLTLAHAFPDKQAIHAQSIWVIKTYGDLASIMRNHILMLANGSYERLITDDYISFIALLDNRVAQWQNEPSFVPTAMPPGIEKLNDLKHKIRFAHHCSELHRLILQQFNGNVIPFTDESLVNATVPQKVYIKVNFGYTFNGGGLIDIAIPVTDLVTPKVMRGCTAPAFVIKIQVQGDKYCHVIEYFPNNLGSLTAPSFPAVGNSPIYTTPLAFFTVKPQTATTTFPDFGNPNNFIGSLHPISQQSLKDKNMWPFCSYSSNKVPTFLYQYRTLGQAVTSTEVLDNILNEIDKIIKVLGVVP